MNGLDNPKGKTFIEKLIENEELLTEMICMPDSMKDRLPRTRREELFSFLWEELDMDRTETMNLINRRELEFVREYGHLEVPDWMLRCEAQDALLKVMYNEFKEQGIIE